MRVNGKRNRAFAVRVKTRLIERGESVTSLARRIGFKRNSVSLAIHQRRRMPSVEQAIIIALGL